MADGDSEMPGINTKTQIGNNGDGFVRIRLISRYLCLDNTCPRNKVTRTSILVYILSISS
jgi:hypothetical protein